MDKHEILTPEEEREKAELEKMLQKSESDSSATEAPKQLDSDDEAHAKEGDALLLKSNTSELAEVKKQVENVELKENKKTKVLNRLKSKNNIDILEALADDGSNPWFRERDCLLLVLQARMLLKELIIKKLKEERVRLGALNVNEIQSLIKSQKEEQESDWISEIQELKRNIINEVRRNHQLERELTKLDKRIALLIKNRGNPDILLSGTSGTKRGKMGEGKSDSLITDPRKLEHYSNLFYLLQTEPKYLANLIYLMQKEQMEAYMDTVIISLYGDAFSPREEFLILRLFQLSIQREMVANKKISDFLKQDSVVPKMVTSYNKRKQGTEYLKTVIGPSVKKVAADSKLSLELKPKNVLSALEVEKGDKMANPDLTEDQVAELKEVA